MRPGLVTSAAAHVLILAWGVVNLGTAKPFEVSPTESLPIEILTPQEFEAMTKGSKTSKTVDTPKIKADKVAEADPEPVDDALPEAKEDVAAPPPPPAPNLAKAEAEAKAAAEKAEKAEAAKAAKVEAEKAEKAEAAKVAKAAAEQKAAADKAAKAEAAKAAAEKAEKVAQAQAAEAELRAKAAAEEKAAQDKAAAEKAAADKAEAEKAAKLAAEKAAQEKAEKLAKAEADKAAKLAAEKAAKEKAEKLAKAEAEKAAKAEAERKAAEAKAEERKFDPNKIASLLKNSQSTSNAPSKSALEDKRAPGRTQTAARETAPETTAGTSRGTATKLSLSQRNGIDNAVREQVMQCWNPPFGAANGDSLAVRVTFTLNADGTLSDGPTVVNNSSNPAFRAAAGAATRAVQRCAPLKLPADAYDYWRQVTINFDPKEMMGG
ncbi:cell envelope integrity protein TolA [Methylopila turkensis]|uniref:Cell envelope integrity protein TolA n=1 Tax=Methylopila turkensis TaxID=1437816 RepID=A0A9W6N5X6_9HYPH|nr:cell envelope integrity protein TolA [Methylopila turkensis]GLK78838.1 hypothetical protein GCM10008174_05790 [Methylopila turkensis]